MRYLFIFCAFVIIFFIISSAVIDKILSRELSFHFAQPATTIINTKNENNPYPKLNLPRLIEVNLTEEKIYFFKNGVLENTFNILAWGPYGKWYQTPTGYYKVGAKEKTKVSSIVSVHMNYAVQMYEDFYIHEKTRNLDGTFASLSFTGGCLRLDSEDAEKFFNTVQKGDQIISYVDFRDYKIKEQFSAPVDYKNFWIRQRFNNPIRSSWLNISDKSQEYIHHAGLDLSPEPLTEDFNVYNIYDGKIAAIIKNGENDHGLGNTVIIGHLIDDQTVYSLYGHLKKINKDLISGKEIQKGEIIGIVGATGYGCDYWRVGKDGCESDNPLDIHLHFEIKTKPVLCSPTTSQCTIDSASVICYGYTPSNPQDYGYVDPFVFLFKNASNQEINHQN